jgi:hypothetical protein
MTFITVHLRAAFLSTLTFLALNFFYSILTNDLEYIIFVLITEFVFIFPIYLFVGNPITFLIRFFLRKLDPLFYYLILTTVISAIALSFIYILSLNNGIGIKTTLQDSKLQIFLFTLLVAIPSIFGTEVSEKNK